MELEELEAKIEKLNKIVFRLQSELQELQAWRHPPSVEHEVRETTEKLADTMSKVDTLERDIRLIKENSYTDVSDTDLLGAYKNCSVGLQAISEYMGCSMPMASRYVNGEVKDVKIRSKLKKYLVEHQNA